MEKQPTFYTELIQTQQWKEETSRAAKFEEALYKRAKEKLVKKEEEVQNKHRQ